MRTILVALSLFFSLPLAAFAATPAQKPIEIGGWIPYWRAATGTADVLPNLKKLTEISPFTYSVKSDGTLYANSDLSQDPWATLIAQAKKNKVRVIPTVMWSDGAAIHRILSNTKTRIALEDEIAALVKASGWNGIDIDFEGKYAETKPYFATFLKGLYMRMGPKWVYCSIEARTPLDSRFETIPKNIEYANDFVAINRYCDRVEIMAYDQGAIDLTLNKARAAPYIPVSDPAWAEKVVNLTAQTISKRKILLGIATYGYEYSTAPLSQQGYSYARQWAFNPKYATDLAAQLGITPVRNGAGELSFIYKPTPETPAPSTPETSSTPVTNNNVVGPGAVFGQAALASQFTPPFNIVWWSDAQAIQDKIKLAQRLGIRGVSIFKLDGGEDQNLWNILPPAVH